VGAELPVLGSDPGWRLSNPDSGQMTGVVSIFACERAVSPLSQNSVLAIARFLCVSRQADDFQYHP
jgi:hypothetical protein